MSLAARNVAPYLPRATFTATLHGILCLHLRQAAIAAGRVMQNSSESGIAPRGGPVFFAHESERQPLRLYGLDVQRLAQYLERGGNVVEFRGMA